MLKYWLSVLLIGITLILVACSESPNSSGGVVMTTAERGGPITINLEQTGGVGAIEVYLASDAGRRIAVAQGQCTGPDSCNASIQVDSASAADGIKVVWSAKHLPGKEFYMSSAYTCSPGSTDCTSNRIDYRYTTNKEGTQAKATFKVDTTNGSITIGGSFSEDAPATAGGVAGATAGGVNYCYGEDDEDLKEGEVIGNAACQAAVNEWVASCGLGVEGWQRWEAGGVVFYDDMMMCGKDGSVTVECWPAQVNNLNFGDFCAGDEGGI